MSEGMPTVPQSKQLFKCEACAKFFRLPERQKGGLCPACFEVRGVMHEAQKSTDESPRIQEEDGC